MKPSQSKERDKQKQRQRQVRRIWKVEIKYVVFVEALNASDAKSIGVLICATNQNEADGLRVTEQGEHSRIPEKWKDALPFGVPELKEEDQMLFDDDGTVNRDSRTIGERLSPNRPSPQANQHTTHDNP